MPKNSMAHLYLPNHGKALYSLICADVPLRNCSLTHSMAHTNFMALSVIEPELYMIKVYVAGIGISDLFCSLTLTC